MVNSSDPLYSILLAAGGSRRYGAPKQLAGIAGRTMLQTAIERVEPVTPGRVILVLGAHEPEIRPALQNFHGIVVINPNWPDGIASSICAAVAQVPPTAAAAMIVLADQPQVTSADLARLIGVWLTSPRSMVAADYAGVIGVPAVFPRGRFNDLLRLRGDVGARHLLSGEAPRVLRVSIPNAQVDVDRPEDLADCGRVG